MRVSSGPSKTSAVSVAGDRRAESAQLDRTLFEGMPIALYRVRTDGSMVVVNQALAELLGAATVGDLLRRNAGDVYVDPSARTQMLERFAAGENNVSYETQFRRLDGTTFWAHCRARAIRDATGALECIEGAVADISDRVAAVAALRESEERYRSLFDSSPLPTWVYAVDSLRFLAVNDAAVKHYGYSRDEFLRMTILDIRPPEDIPRLHDVLGQRPANDREYRGQSRHVKKNGEVIHVDIGSHRFVFDGLLADAVVVRDTTESTRTEMALVDAQRQLQHILASSSTILFMLKPDADLVHTEYVSDNVERITGHSVSDVHEYGWWARNLHPEDADRAIAELAAVTPERDRTSEYRFRATDGRYVWIRATHRIVPTEDGESRLISAWVDITEQKTLETQLFQSQKMEAIGQLAGGIAHDFNNILTAILGTAELGMMNPGLPPDARADLESIRSAGQRAAKITRQLLAFGRKQVIQPRTVSMSETVHEMLPMLKRLLTLGVELETDLAAVGTIEVDPVQLEQVMLNLAVNARDAMPEGGTLTIATRDLRIDGTRTTDGQRLKHGDYVALDVSDTGIGMDAATQARIFEPFFTTKAPGAGTGLGLATVYGIVNQSVGHILVRSALRHGTTFTILFPRAACAAESAEPAAEHNVIGEEVILVVEDEAAVRAPICRALKEFGYQVLEAKHGADALLVLSEHKAPIDLVISDVMMPEMTGTELVSTLKRWYPKLRAILISGYSEELINTKGSVPAGVRYMPKPFSMRDLAQTVRQALDDEMPTGIAQGT